MQDNFVSHCGHWYWPQRKSGFGCKPQIVTLTWRINRDRFWDHFRQFPVVSCHSWKVDLGCTEWPCGWDYSAWIRQCPSMPSPRITVAQKPVTLKGWLARHHRPQMYERRQWFEECNGPRSGGL